MNQLILGDCLEVMKELPDECVDLIYLDPPFFSNRNYEVIWGDAGEVRSFKDRWSGGIDHYIGWLKERVEGMYRLLKPTGSIYLHCDWHANAHIKVDILEKIFGRNNFKNEIIWRYSSGGASKKFYSRNHDTIYFYTKSKKYTFNPNYIRVPRTEEVIRRINTGSKNATRAENLDKLPEDIFEIQYLNAMAKERIGYPTQKPEALLERIILASSNEGDVVLDPFVGGGTTVAVADRLKRKWIGIDQSVQAVKVSEIRLDKQQDLYCPPFTVQLHKYDYDTLRNKNAFEFETWIIGQFGGISNIKQRGDLGLDGKMPDNTPIQVKRSDGVGRNVVDNFHSALMRYDQKLFDKNVKEKKPVGYIIAFSFSKDAVQEVARLKLKKDIIIKLVSVDEIVPLSNRPTLSFESKVIELVGGNWEVEFIANSKAEIEFYSWDFNYDEEKGFKADVIRDPDGKVKYKFGPGSYNIAVKVVDNDGLENIETKTLKVNGNVVIK